MSEVKLNKGLWKVTLIERERGYGQRIIWVRYFDNKEEAELVATNSNDFSDSEDYYVAEVSRC